MTHATKAIYRYIFIFKQVKFEYFDCMMLNILKGAGPISYKRLVILLISLHLYFAKPELSCIIHLHKEKRTALWDNI